MSSARPSIPVRAASRVDVVVVGAGIVGLATARAILARHPSWSVAVLDKERSVGAHQSTHNSGVLHAGVYYAPGSVKARLCATGRRAMATWCADHRVPLEVCGKLVVASHRGELERLAELERRAVANGLVVHRLSPRDVAAREPHVDAVAGLWVPATGVIDFGRVTEALADDIRAAGVVLALGAAVTAIAEHPEGVDVAADGDVWRAGAVVVCAGVHADRLARMAGARTDLRIIPFRGEYHELVPDRGHLVRGLIYPVPDPRLPFLGVHLTRAIDGRVHVGPNAVLALGREAYAWRSSSPLALASLASDPAVRAMARAHWRAGATEVARSASTRLLVRSARRLVPDLRSDDLVRAGAGVRAQAVDADGRLLDDFAFATTSRTLHVLNAPSPAATASLAIGKEIARRLDGLRPSLPDDRTTAPVARPPM